MCSFTTHTHLHSMVVVPRIRWEQLASRNPRDHDGDPLPQCMGLDEIIRMKDPPKKFAFKLMNLNLVILPCTNMLCRSWPPIKM